MRSATYSPPAGSAASPSGRLCSAARGANPAVAPSGAVTPGLPARRLTAPLAPSARSWLLGPSSPSAKAPVALLKAMEKGIASMTRGLPLAPFT